MAGVGVGVEAIAEAINVGSNLYTTAQGIKGTAQGAISLSGAIRKKLKKVLGEKHHTKVPKKLSRKELFKVQQVLKQHHKMGRKYSKRTSKRRKKRVRRRRRKKIYEGFPPTKVVKMKSYHHITMDAAVSGTDSVSSYITMNTNSMVNIFANSGNPGVTINSTEHRPKWFNTWASIYGKYYVVGTKVTVTFLDHNNDSNVCYFVVPCSEDQATNVTSLLGATTGNEDFLWPVKLKEANKRYVGKNVATSAEEAGKHTLFTKVSPRKIEGFHSSEKYDPTNFECDTGRDGTISAPLRIPKIIFGYGSLETNTDLNAITAVVKCEYIVKFSQIATDVVGVSVA